MGAVYLVYDRQEDRQVALKSFPPAARRVEDLAHFEHEFLTLSGLQHPNIARVYDFGVIEGTQDVFFTTEFIDGQDLMQVTEDRDPAKLPGLLVQVCRGLEYIHSREIIHYDVKPTNILVTTEGDEPHVKLIDFGLAARRVDDSLGVIKGTVSYLAPEVARHLPVDHRADLYSLGVTMFQCVTRILPYHGETNLDVVRRVVSDEPPDPADLCPGLQPGLRDLILRLMSKEPGARYQGGNDVIQALETIYGQDFAIEPREATLNFVASGGFFGREAEFYSLTSAFEKIFSWREADDPLAELPPAFADRNAAPTGSSQGFVQTSSGGFILEMSDEFGFDSSSGEKALPIGDWESLEDAARAGEPSEEVAALGPLSHVFLVSGELGVGKSRLLREFKTHAQLRRVAVVEGFASKATGAYGAFVEVFRGVLGLWARESTPLQPRQNDPLRRRLLQRYGTEMARLIPELDDSFLPVTHRPSLSPEEEELRLLDALAQFLIGYSRSRPLVVVLHDLEAADPETLELLRYLVRNLKLIESARAMSRGSVRPLRLMVLGSYRLTEVEGTRQGTVLEELLGDSVVEPIHLAPLDADDVYTLIESMLGLGSDPRALAERIYSETKGNPYFTVELMRSLVESGSLNRQDGVWEINLDDPGALQVPETVAEVILERTRRTTPAEQGPLKTLAVLGRGSSVLELAALLGEETRALVAHLSALEKRQVLFSQHRGEARIYDFIHDLARDAVYESIPPEERLALHETCGGHLERRAELGQGAVDAAELVRHFSAAGNRGKALEYGIRAGDEARAVHANHKAISAYSGALALLPVGSARWRDLLQRTGDLLALTGDTPRAAEVYERLLGDEMRGRLEPREQVRAYRRLGEVLEQRGDFDGALEALSQGAFAAYGSDGLERESAALFAATASIYQQTGRYRDAIGFCEVGLKQLVGLTEGEEAAQVRTVLGRSRLALGELAEAEREFERCLAVRRRQGNEAGMAQALGDLGLTALENGRLDEATLRFEQALERETALGHAGGVARAARRLAQACRELCEYERGISLFRRALNIHEKTGNRAETVRTLVQLGKTYAVTGEFKLAFQQLQRAHEEAQRLGLMAEAAMALNAEAALRVSLGDTERASELGTEALRQASLHGEVPRERAKALETLGRVQGHLGDLDRAEQLLHEAQALFRKQEDPAGVLRTTLSVLRIFLRRGDEDLAMATLRTLEEGGPHKNARQMMMKVEAVLRFGVESLAAEMNLQDTLDQAAALAAQAKNDQLAWQISAVRGRVLEQSQERDRALQSFVDAMSGIRKLLERIPASLRTSYLRLPACVACKDDFSRLRVLAREQ